ncbi:MAG: TRAP transporter TatT component family protein [Treponema sp.]|jgi:predicted anti-sigma-YlaC factor YlaD|nr:TRAP transporter TatT component family protein [Treponema sp.]
MIKRNVLSLLLTGALVSSCSVNKIALNAVSDALTASGGGDVFTGDSDPELVGDAIPFAIKMYESLLASNPNHQGLILTTGSLFIMYANAFVQGPAEMLPAYRYLEREQAKQRAKKFYLRGTAILYSGLDKKYPGFSAAYQKGTLETYLSKMKKQDVPLLYWTVAGTLAAFSLEPFDLGLGFKIPELTAMINRAYELDPDFNNGALDDFYVLFYGSLPETMGGNKALVDTYFKRVIEKTKGLSAGPYISYVQAISIPAQDYETFKTYLETALAIDPGANPANRLANILSQRKARYLLDNAGNFFPALDTDGEWGDE